MNTGIAVAALSLTTALGTIALYYPKVKSNRATLRPRREQILMALALVLAVGGFVLHPGPVGYILAGLAAVPAALFLLATSTSGLPHQKLTVAVGAKAPDFTLTDTDGHEFRLSEHVGSPVLLKFYRGYWCPYCVAELTQLNRVAENFAALGVKLVAISSDRVGELQSFKRKHNWAITLLADPSLTVHRLFNVQHRNFAPKRGPFREIAIPTTVLIDAHGRVAWLEQATDFRVRPQADAVLAKARSLLMTTKATAPIGDHCDVCAA
jgi:peroxiredoxin